MTRVADREVNRVVTALATGHLLRVTNLGGHDGREYRIEKREGFDLMVPLAQLIREGWIEEMGNSTWRLTDKGRLAYLRSADELGDGKLYVPE